MRLGKKQNLKCGPCKVLEPRLEKVLTNHNKKVEAPSGDQQI
ncbi:unnamed protein product, partial [Rotaria magnacalcarata]